MLSKEFIKNVLVGELRDVVANHPYLAFPLIGVGIEYLGRALDTASPWDHTYPRNGQQPLTGP
jgi:hypothetical protein